MFVPQIWEYGNFRHVIYIHFIKPGLLDLFIIHFQFFFSTNRSKSTMQKSYFIAISSYY